MEAGSKAIFIVPAAKAKLFKTELESQKLLDQSKKLKAHQDGSIAIPTNMQYKTSPNSPTFGGFGGLGKDILQIIPSSLQTSTNNNYLNANQDPLIASVSSWLTTLPASSFSSITTTPKSLLSDLPRSYTIYPPLLLLPPQTFQSPAWISLLTRLPSTYHTLLFTALCSAFPEVTHIARNAPIPSTLNNNNSSKPSKPSSLREGSSASGSSCSSSSSGVGLNVTRSPVNLTPLHGDFGGRAPIPHPTSSDFRKALWVSTKQNGITQCWAPLHTMFARGNVGEKARVVQMARRESGDRIEPLLKATTPNPAQQPHPHLHQQPSSSPTPPAQWTAVDLYAGIGYFAFPYARGGATKVLGWEINGWSVEGFRRGAERNGLGAAVVRAGALDDAAQQWLGEVRDPRTQLLLFHMSNERAEAIVHRIRDEVPPVRHVNCGLLPTSRAGWPVAVRVLGDQGGWIHVHENLRADHLDSKGEEIKEDLEDLLEESGRIGKVELKHMEKVKSYAPGVVHCVLDFYVNFRNSEDSNDVLMLDA